MLLLPLGLYGQSSSLTSTLKSAELKYGVQYNYNASLAAQKQGWDDLPAQVVDFHAQIRERAFLDVLESNPKVFVLAPMIPETSGSAIELEEVEVFFQQPGLAQPVPGKFLFQAPNTQLNLAATPFDIFQNIVQLPGIQSPDEQVGGLYIHGGTPDQNLVTWNGIRIYQMSHVYGGLSSLSTHTIQQATVEKAGIDARWGQHTGGLIQLVSQPEYHPGWSARLGLLDVDLGIPLSIGSSFDLVMGLRKSLPAKWDTPPMEVISGHYLPVTSPGMNNKDWGYHDYSVSAVYRAQKAHQFRAHAFDLRDQFSLTQVQTQISTLEQTEQESSGYGLSWQAQWPNFAMQTQWSKSEVTLEMHEKLDQLQWDEEDGEFDLEGFSKSYKINKIQETEAAWTINSLPDPHLNWRIGYQWNLKKIGLNTYSEQELTDTELFDYSSNKLITHAFFASLNNRVSIFSFSAGLRYNQYSNLGVGRLEPRLKLDMALSPSLTAYASFEKKSQNIFQTHEEISPSLEDKNNMWVGADGGYFPLLMTQQQSFGGQVQYKEYLLDVNYFQKHWDQLSSFNYGYLDPNDQDFHIGQSEASGFNLFGQYKPSSWVVWGSWSHIVGNNQFVGLKNGSPFPNNNTQKNTLVFGGSWHKNRFSVHNLFRMASGRPYSRPDSVVEDPELGHRFVYQNLNGETLPHYRRWDLSATYRWGEDHVWQKKLICSWQNITAEKNILQRKHIYQPELDKINVLNYYSVSPTFYLSLILSTK